MSREALHAMFSELAEDVSQVRLAGPVIARVARIRRRRRAAAGTVAVVLILSAATGVLWRPTDGAVAPAESPSATRQSSAPDPGRVDRLPDTLVVAPDAAPYWPASVDLPAHVPSLTEAPLSHAVLLLSPRAAEGSPIYAYGDGVINGGSGDGVFRWVRLDTGRPAGAAELDPGSLGPMGRRAAFAAPDAVIVVDVTTGRVDRIALPGASEDVSWLADGRHVLVSGTTGSWLVDTDTRTVLPAAAAAGAVTPLVGGGSGLTSVTRDRSGGPPVLRWYDDAGLTEQGRRTVDALSRSTHLDARGWRYGNLIAHAAGGEVGSVRGDFVAVIDDRTGAVTHVLDLGPGGGPDCCAVVGWGGKSTVQVYTDRAGLLAWELTSGAVVRLMPPAAGVLSVAPLGCDWTIVVPSGAASCVT